MPIPVLQDDSRANEFQARKADLRVVDLEGAPFEADADQSFLFYPRMIAHFVDICIVFGASVYSSKVFSVILLSLRSQDFSTPGKQAASMFREVFAYSSGQILTASVVIFSVLYFVGLPLLSSGRTFGLGLLGMRICSDGGEPLTLSQLAKRLAGCAMCYATGGALCLMGVRQRDERYLQDVMSRSRIVRG